MTKRELASLACKVLAIYAFICSIGSLVPMMIGLITAGYGMMSSTSGVGNILPLVFGLVPCSLYLFVAACLWNGADALSRRMVHDDNALPHISDSPGDWHRLVFLLIGVFLLANTIPDIAGFFARPYYDNGNNSGSYGYIALSEMLPSLIIKLLLGIWLTFGALSPFEIIRAVRKLGTTPHYGDARDDAVE